MYDSVRRGKSGPSWRDISSGSGSQWGGASWGECVSWVHWHLYESAKAASVQVTPRNFSALKIILAGKFAASSYILIMHGCSAQWREFSARRLVFRGLNEQMRADVYNTMVFVAESLQDIESTALANQTPHTKERLARFRFGTDFSCCVAAFLRDSNAVTFVCTACVVHA